MLRSEAHGHLSPTRSALEADLGMSTGDLSVFLELSYIEYLLHSNGRRPLQPGREASLKSSCMQLQSLHKLAISMHGYHIPGPL